MTWKKDPITGKWSNDGPVDFRPPGTKPFAGIPADFAPPLEGLPLDAKHAEAVWREILRITWREVMAGKRVTWPDVGTFTLTIWRGRTKSASGPEPRPKWPDIHRVSFRLSRKIFATLNGLPR